MHCALHNMGMPDMLVFATICVYAWLKLVFLDPERLESCDCWILVYDICCAYVCIVEQDNLRSLRITTSDVTLYL